MDPDQRLSAGQAEYFDSFTNEQGEESVPGPKRKRAAKLFHKKSRTGCQRCRARRVKVSNSVGMAGHSAFPNMAPTFIDVCSELVLMRSKCNEAKPICHNCERLGLGCVFDREKPGDHPLDKQRESTGSFDGQLPFDDALEPEECEGRRKLELQLFGHYITDTGPSIAVDRLSYEFWVTVLCRMAFKSNALLYAVYFMTALHMSKTGGSASSHSMDVCHSYLKLAIREHQKEVSQLSPDNVDIVCLTSSVFRVYSFVTLQERNLQPYSPPTEWLRVTCSSTTVFRQAWELIKNDSSSILRKVLTSIPVILNDDVWEAAEYRRDLLHLLRRYEYHEIAEPWDMETQAAYESTLSYIGGVWMDMNNHDPPGCIGRRLIIFPMMVRRRFVDLVEERRPRALVILAHYFALLAMLRGYWWLGDVGLREVRAIMGVLPMEWRGMMAWPLQILDEQIIFTGEE